MDRAEDPRKAAGRSALPGLLVLALLIAAAAAARERNVVHGEVEVHLVDLEVFVTDRRGQPVTGLTRDDFELLHDGEPIEITHFGAVTGARAAEASSPDPIYMVVYIDHGYLEPGDLGGVLPELARFLREELGPRDRVMLATAGRGLEIRQGFTSVPELVTVHFSDLGIAPGGGRLAADYRNILRAIRSNRVPVSDIPTANLNAAPKALLSQIEAFDAEVSAEIERTAGRLGVLVRYLAGLPGRKVVVYLGGRIPTEAGRTLVDAWRSAFGGGSFSSFARQPGAGGGARAGAGSGAGDLDLFATLDAVDSRFDAERPLREAAAAAGAGGVTIHTLDLGGRARSSAFTTSSTDPTIDADGFGEVGTSRLDAERALTSRHALEALTSATGGRALVGGRKLAAALRDIGSDLESYYSLGFTPPPAGEAGAVHRLEVRLRGQSQKLAVRHRETYRQRSRDQESAERTIAALLVDRPGNPLEVRLAAGAVRPAEGGGLRIPLSITVPLARLALVADGRAHAGRLSIFLTAGGLDLGTASVRKAVVPVRIPNDELLTSLGRRIEYRTELDLGSDPVRDPGRIAVTVRDDFRPLSSTAIASLGADRPTAASPPSTR